MTTKTPPKIVIYTTEDDVKDSHRFVGYFYWDWGEVANVVFRGSDATALREKILTFYFDQFNKVDGRTKEGRALTKQTKAQASG